MAASVQSYSLLEDTGSLVRSWSAARFRRLRTTPDLGAVATVAFIAIGAGLRVDAFLRRPALWLDELMVALNLADRGFRGLAQPLELHQAAPVGWLWLEKLCYLGLGSSEYALRLPAFVAGLLLLVATAALARQLLPKAYSWIPVAVVALCPRLIEYSHELKPYSSDALLACVLLSWAIFTIEHRRLSCVLVWGGLAGLAAALSLPSLLVAAGTGLVLIGDRLREAHRYRAKDSYVQLACALLAQLPWTLIAVWDHSHLDPDTVGGSDFWAPGYPRHPAELLTWLPGAVNRLGTYLQVKPSVLLFPAVVAGLVALIRVAMRRPERRRITPALAVLAVLAAALVAAALHLYPLMHRAALFLVAPMAVILAALPTLAGARVPRRPVLGQLLAVGLVASLAVLWTTANPSDGGGGRKVPAAPPLALVRAQLQPGDAVLLHVWASGAYRWYGGQLSLPSAQLVLPTRAGAPCSDRPAEERLAGSRRIWAVAIDQPSSGGRLSQEEFFEAVGRLGTPKSSYRFSSGARVVLYDPVLPTGVSPAEHSGPCPTFVARTPPPTTPRQPIWR